MKETLSAYQARSGIEAMFKDCKTGGYNLEGSFASIERLTRLVLLIAIAYTTTALQGLRIKKLGQQKYINRLQEVLRYATGVTLRVSQRRHSNFWTGQYGLLWILGMELWGDLASELMITKCDKLPNFQRGHRAMKLIQSTF